MNNDYILDPDWYMKNLRTSQQIDAYFRNGLYEPYDPDENEYEINIYNSRRSTPTGNYIPTYSQPVKPKSSNLSCDDAYEQWAEYMKDYIPPEEPY